MLNPYVMKSLSPQHLSMLFPATFYHDDESLALHLTTSCLVEATTWEGDNAIGETAFWLKILSTPQTDYLREQKRLFKQAVAEKCKNLCINVPVVSTAPTSASVLSGHEGATRNSLLNPATKANITKPTAVITVQETDVTITPRENLQMTAEISDQILEEENEIGQETLKAIPTPTPGFGLKTFKCNECPFKTDTRERLNHHFKTDHPEERPHACPHCDYTSKYPWNIKTHVENVHLKTKKFKCDSCNFMSPQACLLRRHINRVHRNEKALKCDHCDYRANHKDVLKRHVHMKHTKEFDHKCPYCDFGRDAKYEVEDHINAKHLKKVLYQCSDCSFQTYRKITLRSHHKDHETREVLTCPVEGCNTKTIYPTVLARHMKTDHPGEELPESLKDARRKPDQRSIVDGDADYTPMMVCKCKLCDFSSPHISKLKTHVRKMHRSSSHHCDLCDMSFANKRNLRVHNQRKHSNGQQALSDSGNSNSQLDASMQMESDAPVPIVVEDENRTA